ncbi:VOC family protein [Mycetocola sp.]|jgi:catechol 2,3-dioxygenase-like lactoylglutathione lyase family enzyme|uniref:VOC family protein n=1 Tax=Mycetocola sp. TaxID=1871042 RepID=UPI002615A7E0|nr:VOC family protein [Mycetocola sp.]MCU1560891.1 Glyoxalase/bleomycin resistance protein/dioxygenase [Mycetocola sp.]
MLMTSASFTVLPATDINRAREFYRDKLGLEPTLDQGEMLMYGSATAPDFMIYQTPNAGTAQNTQMCWGVTDIRSAMDELRSSGVTFEEYDSDDLKTVNGIAEYEGEYSAWFRDSEGNFLCLSQFRS